MSEDTYCGAMGHERGELPDGWTRARAAELAGTQSADPLSLITRSRLTPAVNRLRQAGLVDRREDPADGRGRLAVLTAEGRALLERAAPGHVETVRRAVFDTLTTDQVRHNAEISESIQRFDAAATDQATLPWRRR